MEKLINHLDNFGWNEVYVIPENDRRILGVDFKDGIDEEESESKCLKVIESIEHEYNDRKGDYYLQITRYHKSTMIYITFHQ